MLLFQAALAQMCGVYAAWQWGCIDLSLPDNGVGRDAAGVGETEVGVLKERYSARQVQEQLASAAALCSTSLHDRWEQPIGILTHCPPTTSVVACPLVVEFEETGAYVQWRGWAIASEGLPPTSPMGCVAEEVPSDADSLTEAVPTDEQAFLRGRQIMAQLESTTGGYLRATMPDGEQDILMHPGYEKDPEHLWIWGNHKGFSPEQLQRLKGELVKRKDCFAYQLTDLRGYTGELGDFTIPLEHDQEIRQRPRRMSVKELEIVEEKCKELLTAGFITPCTSTKYAQNVVVAAKKDEHGQWTDHRFCIDYRPINKVTPADKYPLHLADDLWDRIGSSKFLTKIDMRAGFHNIRIAPEDQPKTAFWWGNRAYMWSRAPFGLRCIANFFQRVMDAQVARAGLSHCCVCFIDDLLIFSDTAEQHITDVCAVLDAFNAVGLKAHPGKSIIGAPVVEYLGHNVSAYGVSPTEAKVAAIRAIQPPSNVAHLRSVLGLLSYYRCYVPNFGATAAPLNDLLKAGTPWEWDPQRHGNALEALKDVICTPGRVLRRADPSRAFILHTDWSKEGVGAVLGQLDDDGNEYLVACVSRSLNKHERNYSSPQGEMLAAVWGIKSFRHYLRFATFTLSTDHQPLQWLVTTKELSGQFARWALALQEYDFTVVHRAGVTHQNADAVSRMPQATTLDVTGARLDVDSQEAPAPRAAVLAVLGWGHQSVAAYVHHVALNAVLDEDTMIVPWTAAEVLHAQGPVVEPTSQQVLDWECLQEQAAQAVRDALPALKAFPIEEAQPLKAARDLRRGGVTCEGLCTVCVAQAFFPAASAEGVVLYEPFGGLGAGLEMVLRAGVRVRRYLYSDTDPHARAIIHFRLRELLQRFPHLLKPSAVSHTMAFQQDVYRVRSEDFLRVGATAGEQWLVVAGWECQDLSPAGKGKGLAGPRSSSFYPLLNLLATLQLLQQRRPPGFIIENTALQQHTDDQIALHDYNVICSALGAPVLLDAAQFGSFAHRVRNFWTNLADTRLIQRAVRDVVRDPTRVVASILPPHLVPLPVTQPDTRPRYICNKVGEPLRALPCLVAHGCSRAFRDLGPGMLYDKNTQQVTQPDVRIRELAMGYPAGCTAAPGLSAQVRHEVTGRAMDAYCMQFLFAVCNGLAQAGFGPAQPMLKVCLPADPSLRLPDLGGTAQPAQVQPAPSASMAQVRATEWVGPVMQRCDTTPMPVLRILACLATANQGEGLGDDVWDDAQTLTYLQTGTLEGDRAMKRRVVKRAKHYRWTAGELRRVMFDGTYRKVPPPGEREELIRATHEQCGHFGRRRTCHLLSTSFWWKGMTADVAECVRNCAACDRVKATFNVRHAHLHPLPIQGLMYRWGVDLMGPLHKTARGNAYVMIMIEHFSKWVEVAPLPCKESQHTAHAILDRVISRFGAPAEVLTDRGTEFEGAFQDLMHQCMIDHRTTSASHPQADGLAERAVQTMKRALRKLSVAKGNVANWDVDMHWIAMGYRCSVQEATGYSPYALVYGVPPVVPPAVREKLDPPLKLDDVEAAAEALRQRAVTMKRTCVTAAHNLAIAQHRDTLRYARVRSGAFKAQVFQHQVGDYVYVKQPNQPYTLDAKVQPLILRVRQVNHDGSVQLQGKCGGKTTVHGDNCAPCHLLRIDGAVDYARARPSAHMPCQVCGMPDRDDVLLLCDKCGSGWHTFCLSPPLPAVPEGAFYCPLCKGGDSQAEGPRLHDQALEQGRDKGVRVKPRLRPADLREVLACKELDGRVRVLHALDAVTGKPIIMQGKLTFLGEDCLPKCLQVQYADGTTLRLTSRAAKQGLQAWSFTLPEAAAAASPHQTEGGVAVSACVEDAGHWPLAWELRDSGDMQRVLRRLQPGKWQPLHCTRLLNSRPGTAAYVEHVKAARDSKGHAERLRLLQRVVNLRIASSIVDPWADMLPEGAGVYADLGLRVDRNAAKAAAGFELVGDAFQPGWYAEAAERKALGTIVSMPWARTLDVAAPLAAAYVSEAACLEVPVAWVAAAPPARAAWLDRLRESGRLLCIMGSMGLPVLSTPVHWVCIFRHEWVRKRMVRAAYADCKDVCFVH